MGGVSVLVLVAFGHWNTDKTRAGEKCTWVNYELLEMFLCDQWAPNKGRSISARCSAIWLCIVSCSGRGSKSWCATRGQNHQGVYLSCYIPPRRELKFGHKGRYSLAVNKESQQRQDFGKTRLILASHAPNRNAHAAFDFDSWRILFPRSSWAQPLNVKMAALYQWSGSSQKLTTLKRLLLRHAKTFFLRFTRRSVHFLRLLSWKNLSKRSRAINQKNPPHDKCSSEWHFFFRWTEPWWPTRIT